MPDFWLLSLRLQVRVKTGDVPNADFDGKVFLTLFSYWDNSGEIQLINDAARFDRNTLQVRRLSRPPPSLDPLVQSACPGMDLPMTIARARLKSIVFQEFTLKVPNVSYCNSLSLRIDPANGQDAKRWNLESIQVSFVESASNYFASLRDWVDQNSPTVTLTPLVSFGAESCMA